MNIESVRRFRDAAVADGWSIQPTYVSTPGNVNEPQEQAASLEKDGFRMQVLARPSGCFPHLKKDSSVISIWGPDGLAIVPPEIYDFPEIKRGLEHCNNCGKNRVKTQRYSFAGRCCAECRPEMARAHEYSGWTN